MPDPAKRDPSPVHLADEAATTAFARKLAATLQPGDTLALCGTLGAGKTTLAAALVAALGHGHHVTSPTFTLVHEYRTPGSTPVHHLDFYRLKDAAELPGLGWEDILDAPSIAIVEWADRFPGTLPRHTRWLTLSFPPPPAPEQTRIATWGPPEAQ